MPKKTKKAKLIAEYRRKIQQLDVQPIEPTTHIHSEKSFPTYASYTIPKDLPKRNASVATLALPINEFVAIKKDLVKTLIVVSVFLIIEFVVWKISG